MEGDNCIRLDESETRRERHAIHIKRQEYDAAGRLLEQLGPGAGIDTLGDFAREAYARVADMFEWQNFETCRRMTMVGCGPLPVTALHVAARCPHIEIDALDVDEAALEMAARVADALEAEGIRFRQSDGIDYGYDDTQIVYIANLVSPKAAVLRRVAQTAPAGTLVILRDPTRAGRDCAEVGVERLDRAFEIAGLGADSEVFMSRHVFLRLVSA